MAARKDDGQEPPAGNRQAVIWRLPATAETAESADAPAAPEADTDRPKDRRVPMPVVWGLAAALVCVGLYAAWSEFGSELLSASGESDTAAASASATASTEPSGVGSGGGTASPSPPAAGENAPLAAAEDDTGDGAEGAVDAGSVEDAAPPVAAPQDDETTPSETATPETSPPAADPPSPALAADEPQETPAALDNAAAATDEPAIDAAADAGTRNQSSAPARTGADALGALDARLDALEAGTSGAINTGAAVIALEQRVRALEDDPTREPLGRALAAWDEQRAVLEAALAEVSARLTRFEEEAAQQAAADGHLVSLVLAAGELTAALGSSRPFSPALDALRGIAGEDPEIENVLAPLAPFAATGVPTLDGLSARFPAAANAIVRATPANEDSDWIDGTVTRLSQLVTIRRTGGAIDPESLDGRLVEAESALHAGDLGRAIAIFEPLMPAGAEAGVAEPWLRDARARAEADDALASLVAIVHGRIGARWATSGGTP